MCAFEQSEKGMEFNMKNFDSIEDFYRYKEKQSQSGLLKDQDFAGKRDNQYLSKKEESALDTIPEEAIIAIKKFDSFNPKSQTSRAGYNELEVCVPIYSDHMEKTLLYALTSGTAYKIENGNIYIWYKPFKGFKGSGFYKLKRFVFLNDGRAVKYFLDGNEKLPDPL